MLDIASAHFSDVEIRSARSSADGRLCEAANRLHRSIGSRDARPNHPALVPVLVPGYDFTRNQAGSASEIADLNQSTVAVVDGGASPVPMNGNTIAVLDQSTVALVDGPSAFGHGTMVAGIVHLVAPTSYIIPLKAFTADGTGYTSDIIRAVYYAVRQQV